MQRLQRQRWLIKLINPSFVTDKYVFKFCSNPFSAATNRRGQYNDSINKNLASRRVNTITQNELYKQAEASIQIKDDIDLEEIDLGEIGGIILEHDIEINQRFFLETNCLDSFLNNYMLLKDKIQPQNIFILLQGLTRIIYITTQRGTNNPKITSIINEDVRFMEFISQATSFITSLPLIALIDIFKLLRALQYLSGKKQSKSIDNLSHSSKKYMDLIIEQQLKESKQLDPSKQSDVLKIQPIQAADLFMVYNNLKWNCTKLYQLVDQQIQKYSNQNKNEANHQLVYNVHSLRMIIKGCYQANLQHPEQFRFAELAYKVQVALFGSINDQINLDHIVTLYSELAALELHIKTQIKKAPQLLNKLNSILSLKLEFNQELFTPPQVIKLIAAQKFIPAAESSTLFFQCQQFIQNLQHSNQKLQLSTYIKILVALNGQKQQLFLNNDELTHLFEIIFQGLQNNEHLYSSQKLELLNCLISYPKMWNSNSNKLIIQNYLKNFDKNHHVEKVNQLIELGLFLDKSIL